MVSTAGWNTAAISVKLVRDITIIFGPPGPNEDKQRLEESARNSGKQKDLIWLENRARASVGYGAGGLA